MATLRRPTTGRHPRVVLVAAAAATSGGGEKHVADLVGRLPKAGIDIALVCPEGGDLGDIAREHHVPVWLAPLDAKPVSAMAQLRMALTSAAPDVLHAHGARAATLARLADPRAAHRAVYTLHGIHVDSAGSPARRAAFLTIERCLRPRTARFVTVCQADLLKGERLGILTRGSAQCIPNGIELPSLTPPSGRFRSEAGASAEDLLVLSVGRYHEQKDQITLLRAWSLVRAAHPQAILAFVGTGPLEAQLRATAASLDLGSTVRFLPPRPSLADAYADADIFALSSRWEGLPYVVLEAMAHKLPVVCTAVDGIPEAVLHGQTGLLVPPRQPDAMASALLRVLADRTLRERFGDEGRAYVAHAFSLDIMVERLVDLYRSMAR